VPYDEIISIFSLLGISGILVAFCTYIWEKRKERENKENDLKLIRFSCTINLMYALLNPTELNQVTRRNSNIKNLDELKKELQTEWVHLWFFAEDQTILYLKEFLNNPTEQTFANTVLSMRKELWKKSSKLTAKEFSISEFVKDTR
jgi:hypothetical protein